ncbi:MAG: D-alanine--D-serine ligase VanG [Clostridia bacterium]|nr:D-alanine--D-serine ligase VanG [Clostridia bacterium]
MTRLTLAVIFGGHSSEYGISLQSAGAVIRAIDKNKYDVVMLGIDPSGAWFRFIGDVNRIAADAWREDAYCKKAFIIPDRERHGMLEIDDNIPLFTRIDAAFPVLHGKNGEDGTIQGLLELAGIPVVGCKTLSSALCMDKDKAHKLVCLAGVRVPRSFVLENETDAELTLTRAESLGYPLFVKPVKAGSSFGITKVTHPKELPAAFKLAFQHDNKVLVEESIPGFEVGCAVLGNDNPVVGEPDEIELAGGFSDHREKYAPETSATHVPARISTEKAEEIKQTAVIIYKALDCSGFARVDMFLTPSGEIVFNEVNTIPGFTAHSRYSGMMRAAGMTFEQIVSAAIDLAVSA